MHLTDLRRINVKLGVRSEGLVVWNGGELCQLRDFDFRFCIKALPHLHIQVLLILILILNLVGMALTPSKHASDDILSRSPYLARIKAWCRHTDSSWFVCAGFLATQKLLTLQIDANRPFDDMT